jgi:hypothetical protein
VSLVKRAVVADEATVVCTYVDSANVFKSALLETTTGVVSDIKVAGRDIYKSHLHDGLVFDARRPTGDAHGMAIYRDAYTLEPSALVPAPTSWFEALALGSVVALV